MCINIQYSELICWGEQKAIVDATPKIETAVAVGVTQNFAWFVVHHLHHRSNLVVFFFNLLFYPCAPIVHCLKMDH
jgi:hypothetical protein